jgi:CubicO group peptidase (beta-lactamase class C family)
MHSTALHRLPGVRKSALARSLTGSSTAVAAALLILAPARLQAQQPKRAEARVDSLFAEWAAPGSPGAAVAVLRDGEIVLERGYGSAQLEHGVPITPQTIFHVASVSKQFTAFGVALLAARGQLSLDDDVRTHIPELPDFGRRITLRQLVHHTSGIRDQWELLATAGWRLDDVITKDHVLQLAVRQRELNFEPGAEHLYSNMGYTLLAEVVERVGGQPFPEWMRVNVFAPLGMHDTHMHDDHEHVVPRRAYSYRADAAAHTGWRNAVLSYANAGATSMFTTAADLARWLRNYETAGLGGPALIAQMRERGVLNSGDTLPYAFAIVRGEHGGRTTWSHGGADAGFRSVALHFPDERLGVVVLSNLASFVPARLAAAVADIYLGDVAAPTAAGSSGPPAPAASPAAYALSAAELPAYEGTYYSPELEAIYRIVATPDGLVARHVRHGDIPLRAAERDHFTGDRWYFRTIGFSRDAAGSIDGFRLSGGRVRDLRFVRLAPGALPD